MNTTSRLLKRTFPKRTWNIETSQKEAFLTFDDGPTPEVTEWTLDILAQYNAKATFFCIGKNVSLHPSIFKRCVAEGHSIGNHLYAHENGWKTATDKYLSSVEETNSLFLEHGVETRLLRPPYGRMKNKQARQLLAMNHELIMWDVLSKDYDKSIRPEECLLNATTELNKGSIIVFHDSVKAADNMQYALPKVLEMYAEKGFLFKGLHQ
jgi:peptidoglycan/xylan/chitin deacetylase (PgdA/CDA1 family)